MQEFTAPISGDYKLEVWGAAGGRGGRKRTSHGPLGGYAIGYTILENSTSLYIYVGGKGEDAQDIAYTSTYIPLGGKGGYNGGGDGGNAPLNGYGAWFGYVRGGGGGGGATHIANIDKGILSNYSDFRNNILLVAGGGGGLTDNFPFSDMESSGGGESGGNGGFNQYYAGGTQDTGYAFGQGANALNEPTGNMDGVGEGDGGGGGGWYGGYACEVSKNANNGNGGGGSGHINTTLITNGYMQNGVREGNGYAIITWQQLQ